MTQQTEFSSQDAQALIDHAQSAPLQHFQHANAIGSLLGRFSSWFNGLEAKAQEKEKAIRLEFITEREKLIQEIQELRSKLGIGV